MAFNMLVKGGSAGAAISYICFSINSELLWSLLFYTVKLRGSFLFIELTPDFGFHGASSGELFL